MTLIVLYALMEHRSNKTTSTDDIILFVDVAYGVSLLSLLTTLIIYRLNMKQLGSVSNQIEHPLKKARALMVLQCSLYLLLSQVSQLAWVHVTELRPVKTNLTYWLQLLYTLFVVCFYTWCSVLYILNYYLTKYLKNASREISLVYVYILSYSVTLIVFGVILALSQTNTSISSIHALPWKWIVLGTQLSAFFIMTGINIFAIFHQLKSVKRFTNTLESKLRRLYQADKIRNGLVMEFLLLLIWLLEAVVSAGKMVDLKAIVYLVVLINAFLVSKFLI